jgi:hypothetical protein
MNFRKSVILVNLIVVSFSCAIFESCQNRSVNGRIIVTQVPAMKRDVDYSTGDSWRTIPHARIVALDKDHPTKPFIVLTGDFYSANSPEISFDGKTMLFAAQQKESEPWQIWEMNLENRKSRKVTSCKENCTDPAYLPGGRIVFSRLLLNDSLKAGNSLYTCDLNGSNLKRITFNPHAYIASTILNDGRVLTIDRQLYPDQGDQLFAVLRPDGTKAELFYKATEESALSSRGRETNHGKIVFIETPKIGHHEGDVISISYNRPLHSRVNLTSEIKGDFLSVFPLQSGRFLVSYRQSEADRYTLYEFDPEKKLPGQPIFSNKDYDALEAVVAEQHNRPKKLPSEVDTGVKTGLLLCQDINFLDPRSAGIVSTHLKASRIEVLGIDSTLGIVQVEEDGSFYLKVMADKPFRIQTVDDKGHVLQGPCDWIWLRPNERRGCVGCHEDQEQSPENRIALSVKKPPVIIPVHISKVVEKKISWE